MTTSYRRLKAYTQQLLKRYTPAEIAQRLAPERADAPARVPGGALLTEEAVQKRWELIEGRTALKGELLDKGENERYARHIENFIGAVKVPVGLAGPLRVRGLFAQGDFYVPLATTEAALVASYSRGAQLLTEAGGCTAVLLNEGLSRAPGFAFETLNDAGMFVLWALEHMREFRAAAESTTSHGKLVDMRVTVEGNHVYLNFEYFTGDASGQNMVTIATEAVCRYIDESSPVRPRVYFVEANLSGDKKASAQSFETVRGKKVSAEARLDRALVERRLHTTPERMADYWRMSAIGGVLSGTIGVQGHYSNGIAALYLACGQDVACVAESSVGVTRFEVAADGGLYAAVTLPNLVVGTVGGGTSLPSQRACLEILGLYGEGQARAFAELCAALALAGELSIIGALSSGEFTKAHERLARGKAPSS